MYSFVLLQVLMSKQLNTKILVSPSGMSAVKLVEREEIQSFARDRFVSLFLDRIKFVPYGVIISKTLKVLSSLLIVTIVNVSVKHVMNFNECSPKMNFAMLLYSSSPTNKYDHTDRDPKISSSFFLS